MSQFNYVASIIPSPPAMLKKMQDLLNNFIRGGNHHWVSDERLYAPTKLGGLNCIELDSFFKSLQLNWIKRYIKDKYVDFWTSLLDDIFGVTLDTRHKILSYGSEYFTNIIQGHWESNELRNLILTLQEFLREFVTCPKTGDNRFATQPVFYNKNITGVGKGQKKNF